MSDLNALDLEPGEIVGGYTLISRLGGGAMGSVWRVRDDGGQIYAMKILRDSLKDDNETGDNHYQNDDMPSEGNPEGYGNADSNATGNGSAGYDFTDNNAADNEYGTSGYGQGNGKVGAYSSQPGHGSGGQNGDRGAQPHHRSRDPHVTARERMRREAVAMRKIHHPGVCAIVDMELDDSLAFIVTELIEGKNLRDDVAANGRYVGDDLQRLTSKLIDAVRAVHAQGIIHRDIKPTNVMVSASGPVLVDFGIAMSAGESHVTRTGLVMGTPGFIAPEIIDGAESNEATDWWSLASVIAFAATGRPVFGSKPMMAVLEREASGNANLAGLPPNTLNALRSALNPDPAKRCSPDQLLQAVTLDALNPFENGELDDEADENGGPEGVVPPFGRTPRPDPASQVASTDNPRSAWTDDIPTAVTQNSNTISGSTTDNAVTTTPVSTGQQRHQIRGSTRAMPFGPATDRLAGTQGTAYNSARPSMHQAPQTLLSLSSLPSDDATQTLPPPSTQDLTATSAMVQDGSVVGNGNDNATATMPLDPAATRVLKSTTPLPVAAPNTANQTGQADQTEAGTMPMTLEPATQILQPVQSTQPMQPVQTAPYAPAPTPYIYGQPTQPVYTPQPSYSSQQTQAAPAPQPMLQPMSQPMESAPIANPADVRRGKLLSRSILPLWLLAIPLALLSASVPLISICCATALLWFLLTLGYSEEAQLEREGRRGGIRKGGDTALRTVSLPWHILKALLFTVPRALVLVFIAGVGPVVFNLVSGLPTHMVALSAGSLNLPLPLPADLSLSYSSLSLAVFMAAAWLVTAFGPKATSLRIGAGRLRGATYQPDQPYIAAQPEFSSPNSADDGYSNLQNQENDTDGNEDDIGINSAGSAKHRSTHHWLLLAIWLVATLAALVFALANHQIDWVPFPNPQL
ncbi:serine/threonine protein kinase [Bifidobacterium sp. ESL0800]|uniref:serine/threonine protein kinase n=1 Tax=Bifidobacterium sp. ESL0800 TaxID=2983236 RepID=UPI0023F969D1|nr:serine/threonine protein kinase [Bifidobacterium sp. ESL0800]WEV75357.1 protein kinase [Bifidobacterium sp. ESL0800]